MDRKRIFLIIGFILLCILIGFGIYWFFFRPVFLPPAPPAVPAAPPAPPAALPGAAPAPERAPALAPPAPTPLAPSKTARGGLTKTSSLTATAAKNPFVSPDGSSIMYYSGVDGKFYRVGPDGQIESLSDKAFYNVQNVVWSPARDQAILEYPDQSKILYNFSEKEQVTLPKHWQNFSFSPEGRQIAFLSLGLDENNRWLAIANVDGSKTQAIEPVGNNAKKVQVAWSPNNQMVAFSRTGDINTLSSQEIILIGKKHENFKALTVNGINFKAKWSPDGERALYSVTSSADGWKPRLWIVSANVDSVGQNKTPLDLNTWVDKCVFSGAATIYCATPKELPIGAGLYQRVADETADNVYKIDLDTGSATLIAIPDEDHTIDNILVADDESSLYFTDKASGQLFKINLK